MKRLPERINILGTMFHVRVLALPNADCGTSEQHIRLIQIDSSLPFDAQIETLFHEITHMLLKHLGLSQLLDEKTEEAIAQGLGVGLSFVIGANPALAQLHTVAGEDD